MKKLYNQELKINKYVKPGGKTYQKYNSILTRLNEQENILEENSENHFAGIKCAENMKLFNAAIITAQLGDEVFKDTVVHGMDFEDTTQDLIVTSGGIIVGYASGEAIVGGLGLVFGPISGGASIAISTIAGGTCVALYNTYLKRPIKDKLDDMQDGLEEQWW